MRSSPVTWAPALLLYYHLQVCLHSSCHLDEMNGTPFPEFPPRFQNSPSILGAYPKILGLERKEQAGYNHGDVRGSK